MNPFAHLPWLLLATACTAPTDAAWTTHPTPSGTELSYDGQLVAELTTTIDGHPVSTSSEWFRPRHNRLQHGFTFDRPPHRGAGPLAIDVALTGIDGVPHRTEHGITWLDGRRVVATYDELLAWDATGRDLPAHMQLHCDADPDLRACTVRLHVDDDGARYPVTVDPYVTVAELPAKVTGDGYQWTAGDYYLPLAYPRPGTRVWEFVGDTPVDRGILPQLLTESHEIAVRDGRALVIREGTLQLEEWALDDTTQQFEYVGPVPLPPDPNGDPDTVAKAVNWTPAGPLLIAGPRSRLYEGQNLYLLSDASGSWQVEAASELYEWSIPSRQKDLFATSVGGTFTVANYDRIQRRATLRTVVQNGATLELQTETEPDAPVAATFGYLATETGHRAVWPMDPYFGVTDIHITDTDGVQRVVTLPDEVFYSSLDSISLSPTGRWVAAEHRSQVNLWTIGDDLSMAFVERLPHTHPFADDVEGVSYLRDDAHLLVTEFNVPQLYADTYLFKLSQPPRLTPTPDSVDEGATLLLTADTLSVVDLDTPDEDVTLQLVALPTYGDLLLDGVPQQPYDAIPYADLLDGLVSYVHHGDESTEDALQLEACDPEGQCSAVGTLALTIVPVNDPPTPGDDTLTVLEGGAGTVDPLANDTDPDSALAPAATTAGPGSWGTVAVGPAGLTYTHDGSETTSDTVSYTVCDVDGACATGTLAVTITPVNDPPELDGFPTVVDEGGTATIDVLAAATDVDSDLDPASVVVLTAPTVGTATALPDGTVAYTHDGSETTADAFEVQLCDVDGACVTAELVLDVTPVNDAPIPADDTATVDEGGTVAVDLLANDTDVDSDLTAATLSVASAPTHGTATVSGPQLTYTHDGTESVADALVYQLCDPDGACATAELRLTVAPVDDPPVPTDDQATLDQGGTLLVDVLANDVDPDSDTLTVLVVANGQATTAAVAGGQVNLVHDGSDRLDDTVELQVCDATTCVDSTLAVAVTPTGQATTDPGLAAEPGDGDDKGGCGCASGGFSAGWVGLFGLVVLRRRSGVPFPAT